VYVCVWCAACHSVYAAVVLCMCIQYIYWLCIVYGYAVLLCSMPLKYIYGVMKLILSTVLHSKFINASTCVLYILYIFHL